MNDNTDILTRLREPIDLHVRKDAAEIIEQLRFQVSNLQKAIGEDAAAADLRIKDLEAKNYQLGDKLQKCMALLEAYDAAIKGAEKLFDEGGNRNNDGPDDEGWKSVTESPVGELVETSIRDPDGSYNQRRDLYRAGPFWFHQDSAEYVSGPLPTHWRSKQ